MFIDELFVDPTELQQNAAGFIQLLILMLAYGYVLYTGSNLISDGSELLLLIPSVAGIVGSVVLPVLGAVPDGAIVLFSGLGKDAQKQLSVGVGALAGSTIMLLTIPWALAVIAGRVNLDAEGQGSYSARPKLQPANLWSWFHTGVNCLPSIKAGGWAMVLTLVPYFLIQGPAFYADCGTGHTCLRKRVEHYWALAGLLLCFASFFVYLWYQVKTQDAPGRRNKLLHVLKEAVYKGDVGLITAFADYLKTEGGAKDLESAKALLKQDLVHDELRKTLKHFFVRYDTDSNGHIATNELAFLLADMSVPVQGDDVDGYFLALDRNGDGQIDFEEFVRGMTRFIEYRAAGDVTTPGFESFRSPTNVHSVQAQRSIRRRFSRPVARATSGRTSLPGAAAGVAPVSDGGAEECKAPAQFHLAAPPAAPPSVGSYADDCDEDSEEEDFPEDLRDLTPEQQRRRIKLRALWQMGLGTVLVLVFSDPMVAVLSEFGARISVPAFYVSFVLAPLASNASELLASYNYALKKTPKTITISFAALQGAACMNNTFVLGIFLILVYAKRLAWQYSAETISILLVQACMVVISRKSTHRIFDAFVVLALYPLSIIVVLVLEQVVGLN